MLAFGAARPPLDVGSAAARPGGRWARSRRAAAWTGALLVVGWALAIWSGLSLVVVAYSQGAPGRAAHAGVVVCWPAPGTGDVELAGRCASAGEPGWARWGW